MEKRFLKGVSIVILAVACYVGVLNTASADTVKWIVVHNQTGTAISEVYFSETWSDGWGEDFLGSDYIYPNVEYRIYVRSSSCMIDMKTRFVNGAEHTLRFNICTSEHVDDKPNGLNVAF